MLQVSRDGKLEREGGQWEDLEPHFLVCAVDEAPRTFAPHHPRIDHFLFYANFKAHGAWACLQCCMQALTT